MKTDTSPAKIRITRFPDRFPFPAMRSSVCFPASFMPHLLSQDLPPLFWGMRLPAAFPCKGSERMGISMMIPLSSMHPPSPQRPCHRRPDGAHCKAESGQGQCPFPSLTGCQQADSGTCRMVADPYRRAHPVRGSGCARFFPRIELHGEPLFRANGFFRPEPPPPDLVEINNLRLPEFLPERTIRVLGLLRRFVPPDPHARNFSADLRPRCRTPAPPALPGGHPTTENTTQPGHDAQQGSQLGGWIEPHCDKPNHEQNARDFHPARHFSHGFSPALMAQPGRFECALLLHFTQGG